jgi:hypothetical protein
MLHIFLHGITASIAHDDPLWASLAFPLKEKNELFVLFMPDLFKDPIIDIFMLNAYRQ